MKNLKLKTSIKNPIFRERGPTKTRFKYLRLDKNERISEFKNKLFTKIKKKINHNHLTAYPELEKLYGMIAKINKIPKENLVITAGSDGVIRMCFDMFTQRNDKILCLSPTFAMVNIYSKTHGLRQIKINYDKNLNLNLDDIFKKLNNSISLIILANPNSPTGTLINRTDIIQILEKTKNKNIPVLIDEAYFGFSKFTVLPLINKYKNLVVARTFSKAYGLAGCRAGYLATNKELAKKFYSFKPMYEINSIAAIILEEFIKNRIDKKYVFESQKGKKLLINFLKSKKLEFIDTHANFIHINFREKKNKLQRSFKQNNILVKGGLAIKNFENFTRITTGPEDQINKLIRIIKKFF